MAKANQERREGKTAQTDAFLAAYGRLNPGQKKAVDTVEGPVMVIAGPGTGKTQILALRIANILRETDVPPSAILSLTFTESGVASMRARLRSLIGARAYEVRIHTFHGFANRVIKRYPERFPRIVGGDQITELDALSVIERILDGGTWEYLRPVNRPYLYVRDIKGAISDAKRENLSPVDLVARITEEEEAMQGAEDLYHEKGAHKGKMKGAYADALKRLAKARECARVYESYEQELAALARYDFEDTILEVVHALERDAELKLILQEEHQYILADEHQDANGAQNRTLELLSDFHESPNLFIVGDEKQAIYRFQGASLENFLFFKRRYPDAVMVELSSNYRSTQVILDAAHDVIVPARGDAEVPRPRLESGSAHEHRPVAVHEAQTADAEMADLAAAISALIAGGVQPGEIAVLMRRNADVAYVAKTLRRAGIATASLGDVDVLAAPAVRELIALLRAAAHFGRDNELYPLLYASFASIPNLDIFRLTEGHGSRELYATLGSEDALQELGVSDVAAAHGLFVLVDGIATRAKDQGLSDVAFSALERSGMLVRLAGSDRLGTELESLRAFLAFVEDFERAGPTRTIRDLITELERAEAYRLSLIPALPPREDAVRVMTAHKAKGMEFDHVFIPECIDARWGGKTSRATITLPIYAAGSATDEGDDERRLFYVAMTRARKSLVLSYARTGEGGRETGPSRFLADISDEHTERVEVPAPTLPLVQTRTPALDIEELRAYVRARLSTQGMSVSALNNYLESPWKYFFMNLLRMPQRKEPYQYFGTAVDGALRFFTRSGGSVTPEAVVEEFVRIFARAPLSDADRTSYRTKGEAVLRGYLAELAGRESMPAEAGVSVAAVCATGVPELPELTLKGEFDLIEQLPDGRIRVVDWKTGTPKTRGYIEGTTKDSNGNYKRQLTFYTLLASMNPPAGRAVAETAIEFIEPDKKGAYHREPFVIPTEDVDALRATIGEAVRDIISLSFLDTECDPATWSEEGCLLANAVRARFLG